MGLKMSDFSPEVQAKIREQLAEQDKSRPARELIPPERRGMNKTELRYSLHLDMLKATGEVLCWIFEPFGLRLGAKCFYHPDFLVWRKDGRIEIHEVKGFWQDDARVKIKAAAGKFGMFEFIAVKWVKKTWEYERL